MQINDSHFLLDHNLSLEKASDNLLRVINDNEIKNILAVSLIDEPWSYKEFYTKLSKISNVEYVREINPHTNVKKQLQEIEYSEACGIKLHPRLREFNLKKTNVYKAIESLNNPNSIVMICAFWDGNWNKYGLEINQFADLADAFPERRFVWSHSGGHKILDFMFMARRRQNVFLDTSFTQHYFFGGSVFSDLVYSINSLPDRFVFGSDFEEREYTKSLQNILENYKKMGIEESALIKLMSQNFYKLVSKNG